MLFFGVDLGFRLDQYPLSRLTDGTLRSSSDLFYFTPHLTLILLNKIVLSSTPFLPVTFRTKLSYVQFLFPLLLGQQYSKSHSSSTKLFQDNSKFCLSRKIIPISEKCSKSYSFSDLENFPLFAYPFHTLATGV